MNYTTAEAAAFLGISKESLLKAERRGWIQCDWVEHHGQAIRQFSEPVLISYRDRQKAKLRERLTGLGEVA